MSDWLGIRVRGKVGVRGRILRKCPAPQEALEDFARVADAARQGGDAENPDLVELEACA